MAPEDAPQFGTLPDLGRHIRAVLSGEEPRDLTSGLLGQALPCLRKAHKALPGPATAALNLLLALLLGLYQNVGRRPCFRDRVTLYGRLHRVMTSEPSAQASLGLLALSRGRADVSCRPCSSPSTTT